MKPILDPLTTPEQKYSNFQEALRCVLRVSKADLNRELADAERMRRNKKSKPGPKPRGIEPPPLAV
jgi:hypothetical protein